MDPSIQRLSSAGQSREELMSSHKPYRDIVGAMEKALAEELAGTGYHVLKKVSSKHPRDPAIWEDVRTAFAAYFPKIARAVRI